MDDNGLRRVRDVYVAHPTLEGAGVRLKRAFGQTEVPDFDPFLLLDDFRSDNPMDYLPGFPWHPHRGIETVTYVLDGRVEHEDSMGNRGAIMAGDVQWMTAGSGIVHQEMPRPRETSSMAGFQLWVNLPREHKMRDPRYQEVAAARIPEVAIAKGVKARLVAGRLGDVEGPVKDITVRPSFMDVTVEPGAKFEHTLPRGHTAFAYLLEGRGRFEGDEGDLYESQTVLRFTDGDRIAVRGERKPLRFFLVSGRPTGEPVAWWGPIVMNSQGELKHALEELQEGTFIKKRGQTGTLSRKEPATPDAPDPRGYSGGSLGPTSDA